MTNYVLGDLVARLKTGSKNRLKWVRVSNTRISINFIDVLYKIGLIRGFKIYFNYIEVFLKYYLNRPVFLNIELVSTPGKKVYWSLNKLSLKYKFNSFAGFFIISTSKGLVTSNDCLIGGNICGKVLFKIYI